MPRRRLTDSLTSDSTSAARPAAAPPAYTESSSRLREATTRSVTFRVRSAMTASANCDCFLRLNMRHPHHEKRVIEHRNQVVAHRVEYQRRRVPFLAHIPHLRVHEVRAQPVYLVPAVVVLLQVNMTVMPVAFFMVQFYT